MGGKKKSKPPKDSEWEPELEPEPQFEPVDPDEAWRGSQAGSQSWGGGGGGGGGGGSQAGSQSWGGAGGGGGGGGSQAGSQSWGGAGGAGAGGAGAGVHAWGGGGGGAGVLFGENGWEMGEIEEEEEEEEEEEPLRGRQAWGGRANQHHGQNLNKPQKGQQHQTWKPPKEAQQQEVNQGKAKGKNQGGPNQHKQGQQQQQKGKKKNNKKGQQAESEQDWGNVSTLGDWLNGGSVVTGTAWPGESGVGWGSELGIAPAAGGTWPGSELNTGHPSIQQQQHKLASLLNQQSGVSFHPEADRRSAGAAHYARPKAATDHNKSASNDRETSRTLRYATTPSNFSVLDGGGRGGGGSHMDVTVRDSGGIALEEADMAFYNHKRPADTRIYWSFDPKKDPRVHSLLTWIGAMGHALATLGVHKFLETGERGALMANATYRHPDYQDEPCFDWVTFEDVVDTHDKILQESMAFYSPENQVLVFIFLLSESGNSMAIWRRKLDIPLHVHNQWHIDLEKTARILSKKKYVITVDSLPPAPKNLPYRTFVTPSSPPPPPPPPPPKKKKWYKF
ncbi:hypothetical protein M422DRAFT_62607 [Sphaerobolus stellatus SS14]|nr:hypothetical protein M422DRAFT_62607 [Sphaerobolus stellatus SS14]